MLDFDDPSTTIEHVLPENPSADWDPVFPAQEVEREVYRLGNFTLLESKKNKDAGNTSFDNKKIIYDSSVFKMTQEIAGYEEWSPVTLQKRQERLAQLASQVWRIDL